MIFRSPYPDTFLPETDFTSYVLSDAARLGDKPALIDGPSGRTLTFAQLAAGVGRLAAGLTARGFKKGEVFAIFCPNVPEYAAAFLSVARLGGIITTINPLYTVEEITFQLKDTGAKFLLTIPLFIDKAVEAAANAGVQEIFFLGAPTDQLAGATPFANLMASAEPPPEVKIDPHKDLLMLPFSSGTTGLPKGVMLTHHNVVSQLAELEAHPNMQGEQVSIAVLPFFHIYGMIGIMALSIRSGNTVVSMPRFDLEQFLQLIQQYRVTQASVVPPIILALAKHPVVDKYDLSSLRYVLSGAAPLGVDLQQACAIRIGCPVVQGYGMTETSVGLSIVPLDNVKPGSAGVLNPNVECKVIDYVTGAELEANEQGEIWVRGPNIMQGYWNQPAATALILQPDGWLRTGDIGYVDEDGFMFIVDRIKELIKYKGLQVAPAELEAVLVTHPAVADVAVIGVPDEEAGEVPKAFVVLKSPASEDDLREYVAGRVARHKRIRYIEFIEQIPKSLSGKILRRVLVEQERAKTAY